MSELKFAPRTYNQTQVPRKYTPGKRRFSVYWTWSYPWEANRDVTELDNRFSTMTEVRRVAWPEYESLQYSEKMFLQGIAGALELFHLSLLKFQSLVGEVTEHPVAVYQRIDQAGQRLPLDERVLSDTDTLMVFGLDHMVTEQEASPEEVEAPLGARGERDVPAGAGAGGLVETGGSGGRGSGGRGSGDRAPGTAPPLPAAHEAGRHGAARVQPGWAGPAVDGLAGLREGAGRRMLRSWRARRRDRSRWRPARPCRGRRTGPLRPPVRPGGRSPPQRVLA